MTHVWLWLAFAACVLALLGLDLGVVNRRAHRPSLREAALWSAAWLALAAAFGTGIAVTLGAAAALEFATGYVVEEALSVDNLFVFLLIFSAFRVPAEFQHRVLFWGIFGALALRGAMIGAGTALVEAFAWATYVFGAFLLVSGVRLALRRAGDDEYDPSDNPALRLVRRVMPVTRDVAGPHFFVRERAPDGSVRRAATPLFVVLVLLETTDLVFAVDSIPAIFGVTRDPFLIYTSNVFAILGLRSVFFLLAGVMDRFHYLRYGLAVVLAFVGAKMLVSGVWEVPTLVSLGVVVGVLGAAVGASLAFPRRRVGSDA
ncbi:membrane protein [Gemmatimonadetes bacterium T265]|nr:membrane protein [Gemmatimonadetes bacterium T265]